MTVSERLQMIEAGILSPYGSPSIHTKGRDREEPECSLRTPYQRDRDRIFHSKAFRRLKGKTQVFLAPEGDHYRTRLTHTLEVSQIARTITRALGGNEDLTEAIALGHDLGHTPFGHAGEKVLDNLNPTGFAHFDQSLRVVERLENGGMGLNLTQEVRNGIQRHTKGKQSDTLEGRIVRLSDRIAYVNHDIDDALRAGILTSSDLPRDCIRILGESTSSRVNTLVHSTVESTAEREVAMSKPIEDAFEKLHSFMFKRVYTNPISKAEEKKVPELIRRLYEYYSGRPTELPEDMYQIYLLEGIHRAVTDYIAGMTDHYAIHLFENLFVPTVWQLHK